ncbi:MAG: SpoIIE family protein phosphatase [Bacteroidetes bacterium]|nr:SpoIIE family protein phosphatase [Bacteroidota bacterium]
MSVFSALAFATKQKTENQYEQLDQPFLLLPVIRRILIFLFLPVFLHAGKTDTLSVFFQKIPHDTSGVRSLINIAEEKSHTDNDVAFRCSQQSVQLAYELNEPRAKTEALFSLGVRYMNEGDYVNASKDLFPALSLADSIHYDAGLLIVNNGIGNLYAHQDLFAAAAPYYEKALTLSRKLHNRIKEGVILGNLGNIYYMQIDDHPEYLPKAKDYYEQYLNIAVEEKNTSRMISALNNLALVYGDMDKYDTAIALTDSAMKYILALNDSSNLAYSFSNYGRFYRMKNEFVKAIGFVNKSIEVCRKLELSDLLATNYQSLAICYEGMGDYKNAYLNSVRYDTLEFSLISTANANTITDLKNKLESDRQQNQIDELKQKNEIGDLRNGRQNLFLAIAIGGFVLLAAFAFLLYNRYRVKSESNKKLEVQNEIIAEKNKDITDSINYASKIQNSLLTSEETMKLLFNDFFVLFLPRDIVSGDFWWVTKKENKIFLCAADCTGHGVPGAFMSLLSISFLNEAVNEKNINSPAEIFGYVRDRIIASLGTKSNSQNSDGMDAVLCCIDEQTHEISFAAANNPLWIVRNGKCIEYKADKMPVGKHYGESQPFRLQRLTPEKNDVVYLFSDGYADQFGGERARLTDKNKFGSFGQGKKFKYKPLQELLLKISSQPFEEQKKILERNHLEWKGELAQVDDILVMGFRIS